jgi:pimeloyl-ACP methyl ester carboxylesterase
MARHVIFIHGMYLNGQSWQPWVDRFTGAGFSCSSPSWPYHDGDPKMLRSKVDPGLGRLTFGAVSENLKALIDTLPERPLLVGHSIGGLLVQRLVNDGFARAGVAISSAPPQGVVSFSPHFLRANFPHINPLAGDKPVLMTPERFHYAFANTLSRPASDDAFDRFVVPESRNVPRSTLGRSARIDFTASRAPLLFLTGDQDHLTPVAMVRRNARKFTAASGQVEYREFAGRSHYICGEGGLGGGRGCRPRLALGTRMTAAGRLLPRRAGGSLMAQARRCWINDTRTP